MGCWVLAVDWSAVGSMLSGIGGLAAGGATVALAMFGWQGLTSWKQQKLGSRQIELAEETLAAAFEAAEVVKYMRGFAFGPAEIQAIPRKEGESEEQWRTRATYDVSSKRYMEHVEKFSHLRTLAFRARANFGEAHYQAVVGMLKLPQTIMAAASRAYMAERHWQTVQRRADRGDARDAQIAQASQRFESAYNEFWGIDDDKRLEQEEEAVIARCDEVFGPLLRGDPENGSVHGLRHNRRDRT